MSQDTNSECSPLPDGYKVGRTKYVVVLGTVMSGLGKGIFAGSLARVLQDRGLRVSPMKLEGYLNMDAGTLNPIRHGEVFVLDDGTECDMDLGNYERMLNIDLACDNFTTSGQVFASILERERSGGYLGRDVQMIPHVADEIKSRLRKSAVDTGADVVFIEIGGTVGDLENGMYIEACRQLATEEGRGNVCFVALAYVPHPPALGEQKSKPAQLGLRQLMSLGIMPDIIAVRSHSKMSQAVRDKMSLFGGIAPDRVFGMHDIDSASFVPDMIREAGVDSTVMHILDLHGDNPGQDAYAACLRKVMADPREMRIGIAGKYTALRDAYASIIHALEHAATDCGASVTLEWINTDDIDDDNVAITLSQSRIDGLIVPGGFGYRSTDGKMACIRYARETVMPFLGLCYGFQLAVIEFARNMCGLKEADSAESNPESKHKLIDILPGQPQDRIGGTMRLGGHDIALRSESLASRLYLGNKCRQRFRHRYEFVTKYAGELESKGLIFSGAATDGTKVKQILEIPGHPFFMATQGHPELTSRPSYPEPMFRGFVKAVDINSGRNV